MSKSKSSSFYLKFNMMCNRPSPQNPLKVTNVALQVCTKYSSGNLYEIYTNFCHLGTSKQQIILVPALGLTIPSSLIVSSL